MKNEERNPVDQWLAVNQMLHLHQAVNYLTGSAVGILIVALVVLAYRSPIVVVMKGHEKHYYQSESKADSISEKDVENFVSDFLEQMFTWNQLIPDDLMKQITPFLTSGLADKIRQEMVQRAEKDFKGKILSEGITNIHVQVTEKEVLASFDKVIRIDGVPLVVPTQIAFSIIRGSSTQWNPMGLYVNGLMEHEGAK